MVMQRVTTYMGRDRAMRFLHWYISLLSLLCIALPATAQISFTNPPQQPPAVQARSVEATLPSDTTQTGILRIVVHIPSEHHGYLDKGDDGLFIPLAFTFAPFEERGMRVTPQSRPQGTRDDKTGVTVIRGQGEFVFHLTTNQSGLPTGTVLPATLRYQICNDTTNICYPPRTTEIPVSLTRVITNSLPPGAGSALATSQAEAGTLQERLTSMFHRHMGNLFLAFALVLCTGLLAAATPCVYPIIPITSALLMARGGTSPQQGRLHALVYFSGMIFFYTLLGAFAALTGTALSALMTNAWVNIGFAVLFAYLGLSMLGLFEFQLLPALTAKLDGASARWSGFTGTFVMGSTAGLIVSPCIGPIVGAILLQITGQSAAASAVEPHTSQALMLRGIVLMTGFGAGLGLPFLIVGLLSHRLPQSGQWLSHVKFLLGLPILYFAYTYYLKGMETHGVPVNIAHAILLGIVAILIAVFLGAFHSFSDTPHRGALLRRACGIILLIIGIHFLYNGLGRSGILLKPYQTLPQGPSAQSTAVQSTANTRNSPPRETHGNLQWWRDFLHAQQQAKTEQKPLFVDFYATWCANCKAFQHLTVRNTQLNAALQRAVLVKIYDTDAIFQTFQQNQLFPELRGVGGQPFLPLFAIYSPQGALVWKGQNYQAVQTMMAQLEHAAQLAQP